MFLIIHHEAGGPARYECTREGRDIGLDEEV